MSNTRHLVWIVAMLSIALLLALGFKGRVLLAPQQAGVLAPLDPDCDLHSAPCSTPLPYGGTLELSLAPRPIEMLQPLALEVRLQGVQPAAVAVDFSGVEMFMGYNRVPLTERAPGFYAGTGMLPVCVTERMTWEVQVLLETAQGPVAAPFRFETTRR
ncbi:hypothetical protein HUS23_08945 [Ectothiorhodospiraceae bacterium 2226]|nr:hypothetical protein HUS23_08945 [Ectothiorhodospiraceae bacterium 2226]